jgi:hypothetical protein
MATLSEIYIWFMTGKKPTQAQFYASWGSFWHKLEKIPQSAIAGLISVLNSKADKTQFDAHKTDDTAHATLFAKVLIIPVGKLLICKVQPNENEFQKEPGDYCFGVVGDTVVNGTWNGLDDSDPNNFV